MSVENRSNEQAQKEIADRLHREWLMAVKKEIEKAKTEPPQRSTERGYGPSR